MSRVVLSDQTIVKIHGAQGPAGAGGGGGSATFAGLTDTPSDYAGHALELVRVNAEASALEFYDAAGLSIAWGQLSGVPATFAPSAHTHTLSELTDAGTAAGLDVPAAGDAAAGEVVKGNDSRLSDARTPTAHTHTLAAITDAGTAAASDAGDFAAAVHAHDAAAIDSGLPSVVNYTPSSGDLAGHLEGIDDALGASGGGSTLGSLTDVTLSAPANLDVLAHNGANWSDVALTAAHIQSGTFADDRIAASSVTQHAAAIDHDALSGFVADEHATPKRSLEIDAAQIQLVGDVDAPGLGYFYGTDALGARGWYPWSAIPGATALGGLSDTTISTPASGDALTWDGAAWVNAPVDYGDLANVPATFAPSAHNHSAGDITTGTLSVSRGGTGVGTLPGLPSNYSLAGGQTGLNQHLVGLDDALGALNASNLASGTVPAARLPAVATVLDDIRCEFLSGSTLTTGEAAFRVGIEAACSISSASLVLSGSDSMTVTVNKYTPSGGSLGSPTALGTVSTSSAQYSRSTGLAWSLAAGDVLEITITSAPSSATSAAVALGRSAA